MKSQLAVLVLGLSLLSSGCNLVVNFGRNLVNEPRQSCNEIAGCIRNRLLACAAWNELQKANPNCHYSADYQQGFKAGFADYLEAGGTGAPPPLPPHRYWDKHAQTPPGHEAAAEWFAGFHHGVAAAQASGWRHWITVPLELPPPGTGPSYLEPGRTALLLPPLPETTLPVPRPVAGPAQPQTPEERPPGSPADADPARP